MEKNPSPQLLFANGSFEWRAGIVSHAKCHFCYRLYDFENPSYYMKALGACCQATQHFFFLYWRQAGRQVASRGWRGKKPEANVINTKEKEFLCLKYCPNSVLYSYIHAFPDMMMKFESFHGQYPSLEKKVVLVEWIGFNQGKFQSLTVLLLLKPPWSH